MTWFPALFLQSCYRYFSAMKTICKLTADSSFVCKRDVISLSQFFMFVFGIEVWWKRKAYFSCSLWMPNRKSHSCISPRKHSKVLCCKVQFDIQGSCLHTKIRYSKHGLKLFFIHYMKEIYSLSIIFPCPFIYQWIKIIIWLLIYQGSDVCLCKRNYFLSFFNYVIFLSSVSI